MLQSDSMHKIIWGVQGLKKIGTANASVLDYNIHEYAYWDDRVSRGFVQHELPGLCKKGAAVVIKYIIVNFGSQICWY